MQWLRRRISSPFTLRKPCSWQWKRAWRGLQLVFPMPLGAPFWTFLIDKSPCTNVEVHIVLKLFLDAPACCDLTFPCVTAEP